MKRKQKTFFVLIVKAYTKLRRRRRDDYPSLKISVASRQYFMTLAEAEAAIPQAIDDFDDWSKYRSIYCLTIIEQPFGVQLISDDENYSARVYDANGRKLDERLFKTFPFVEYWPALHGEPAQGEYYGRPPEKVRFKIGDVLEYRGELGVVGALPPAPRDNPCGDDTDDCYLVWTVDEDADKPITLNSKGYVELGHDHPNCLDTFEPRFEMSEKILNRIKNIRDFINSPDYK